MGILQTSATIMAYSDATVHILTSYRDFSPPITQEIAVYFL